MRGYVSLICKVFLFSTFVAAQPQQTVRINLCRILHRESADFAPRERCGAGGRHSHLLFGHAVWELQTGPQTLSLFVNGACDHPSRQLYTGAAPNSIPTEAALLVNDCTSNSGVSPNGSGFSCAPNGSFLGGTPTQGFLQNGALTFAGFTLPVIPNGSQFQLRITNVRVNANSVAAGTFITGTVLATFGLQNQQNLVMGAVEASLGVSVSGMSTFPQCGAQSQTINTLTIKELVNNAFKSPASASSNSTPGQWYQSGVNSESQTVLPTPVGWVNQLRTVVPGQADVATRIRVNVSNIPEGVSVSMPLSINDSVGGSLVYNPGGDVGPFTTGSGGGIVINNFGSVTYEVRAQSGGIDSFTVPMSGDAGGEQLRRRYHPGVGDVCGYLSGNVRADSAFRRYLGIDSTIQYEQLPAADPPDLFRAARKRDNGIGIARGSGGGTGRVWQYQFGKRSRLP